jgi:hypothetical protein
MQAQGHTILVGALTSRSLLFLLMPTDATRSSCSPSADRTLLPPPPLQQAPGIREQRVGPERLAQLQGLGFTDLRKSGGFLTTSVRLSTSAVPLDTASPRSRFP